MLLHWVTGSLKQCQKPFPQHSGGWPGNTGTIYGSGSWLHLPSLRRPLQDTDASYSSCLAAARKGRIRPYRAAVVQELQPLGIQKSVACYCQWFEKFVAENSDIFFMKLGFTSQDTSTYRIRFCELLQILMPFTRYPCIHIKAGGILCSVTYPHSCSHFLPHHRRLRCLPRHFSRFVCNLDDRKLTLRYFHQDSTVCHRSNRVL
jgi:hypothetical protein